MLDSIRSFLKRVWRKISIICASTTRAQNQDNNFRQGSGAIPAEFVATNDYEPQQFNSRSCYFTLFTSNKNKTSREVGDYIKEQVMQLEKRGVDIPYDFICPISQQVIIEPVFDPDHPNHYYEREAILQWLTKSFTNPLTRQPLEASKLKAHPKLIQQILEFIHDKIHSSSPLASA